MNGATWRRLAESGYVAVIVCLAIFGGARESAPFYLVAIALTLPFGIVAVLLIYGGYALLEAVGGLWASSTLPDGSDAAWLSTGSAVLNVVALLAAALANVLLLEWWCGRSSGPDPREGDRVCERK